MNGILRTILRALVERKTIISSVFDFWSRDKNDIPQGLLFCFSLVADGQCPLDTIGPRRYSTARVPQIHVCADHVRCVLTTGIG